MEYTIPIAAVLVVAAFLWASNWLGERWLKKQYAKADREFERAHREIEQRERDWDWPER
jgi:hypothetical protein